MRQLTGTSTMQKKDNSGATKEIPQSGVLQFPREFKYRLAILRRTASGTLLLPANDRSLAG